MSVLALVTKPEEARDIVTWSARFAATRSTSLTVLCWTDSPTPHAPKVTPLREPAESEATCPTLVRVREEVWAIVDPAGASSVHLSRDDVVLRYVRHPRPLEATLERVRIQDPGLLIVGGHTLRGRTEIAGKGTRSRASADFLRNAPCDAIALYAGDERSSSADRILLTTTDGRNDRTALQFASQLTDRWEGSLTALRVEENIGPQAIEVGRRDLGTLLRSLNLDQNPRIETSVVLADDSVEGIAHSAIETDLVVVGDDIGRVAIDNLLRVAKKPTVAVISRKPPLRSWDPVARFADWIPHINPADYADLYQRLLSGSRWNIDFVMMLGLATIIASLGLLQDSAAVVIGSMLLAPLMTPMIGAGLALVQGNYSLAKKSSQAIGFGFLMALFLSFCVGALTPGQELTQQLAARGDPNVLDLLIALFSAVAAAFALARPGIAAAVAGVAIATALVPPLSTVGISLSYGEFNNAAGAAILFVTNLVAIVIGAAITFRAMGIAGAADVSRQRVWVFRTAIGLATAAILLAVPLALHLDTQIHRGKAQPMAFPVTREVATALLDRVAEDPGVHIILAGRPGRKLESDQEEHVSIVLGSNRLLPHSYAQELTKIVRREMEDESVEVRVFCLQQGWKDGPPKLPDHITPNPTGVGELASGAE